jgi:hypothetical protein
MTLALPDGGGMTSSRLVPTEPMGTRINGVGALLSG